MNQKTVFPSSFEDHLGEKRANMGSCDQPLGMLETLKARSMCPSRDEIEAEGLWRRAVNDLW
jgi:hypothetical protein